MYSLAIVLKEILCKNAPFEEEIQMLNMTAKGNTVKLVNLVLNMVIWSQLKK